MEPLKPPGPLCLESNIADNWRRWRQRFELYLAATEKNKKPELTQCALFLHVIGEAALDVYNTFCITEAEKNKIQVLFDKFQEYCEPKKNITFERHRFFSRNQTVGESIDQYVTELRMRAKSCEFGELNDSLIRDKIVCGICDDQVRERLLRDSELTLQKAIDFCRAAEVSREQISTLKNTVAADIHAIGMKPKPKQSSSKQYTDKALHLPKSIADAKPFQEQVNKVCGKCGKKHPKYKCPAHGKTCHQCGKLNHFSKQCSSKNVNKQDDRGVKTLFLDSLRKCSIKSELEWTETVCINNYALQFKLDTGAQASVLPMSVFRRIRTDKDKLFQGVSLSTYSGEKLPVEGQVILKCTRDGIEANITFIIVVMDAPPILGLQDCLALKMIKRLDKLAVESVTPNFIEEYADLFVGIGSLPGTYHIELKEDAKPCVHPPRKVPLALHNKLKAHLDDLVENDIIVPVTEPTDWVNSLVIIEKKDSSLRLCLDCRELNDSIKREHYPLPTLEELLAKLGRARYFTLLDASSGFWQLHLDEESSKLTTFNTPFGRFRFLRMPFGLKSAPEIFHRVIAESTDDLAGVMNYLDDVLAWGETEEEHDRRVEALLQRGRQMGIKFTKRKCSFRVQELVFLGHRLTADGIKPDEEKVKAIAHFPTPTTLEELLRFLGMVNFLHKFLPHVSDMTRPLRELTKEGVEWSWSLAQDNAFQETKSSLINAPVLRFYDVNKAVVLSVDASPTGLGAILLQEGAPVAYASTALTETERRYAHIEKELLAVVFACTRFNQFVYGKEIVVESDHKPLEGIFKKPLAKCTPRMQRLLASLQKYDIKLRWRPGKELIAADALSRAHLDTELSWNDEEVDHQVHALLKLLPASDAFLARLQQATAEDQVLNDVQTMIRTGWPTTKHEIPNTLMPYWTFRSELSSADGVVFKEDKIVIPIKLRADMLSRIHEHHLGIEKCKQRAREVMFWPGMQSQITEMVQRCESCQLFQRQQTKEPMISTDVPDGPWTQVGSDLFHLDGKDYVLFVDYYSKYVEVCTLRDTKSETIIAHAKSVFARHGIPVTLITDNGTQYTSRQFKQFAKEWDFNHITSSPEYPRSNGLAERTVQTVKNVFKKSLHNGNDLHLALLALRNTPIDNLGSPAQLLMGRRQRTRLPISATLLKPEVPIGTKRVLERKKESSKAYYDRISKPLQHLCPGDSVRYRNNKVWLPAVVLKQAETPRSYIIQTSNGSILRRNRLALRQSKNAQVNEYTSECDNNTTGMTEDNSRRQETLELPTPNNTKTRSGRLVRPPPHFKDYVT